MIVGSSKATPGNCSAELQLPGMKWMKSTLVKGKVHNVWRDEGLQWLFVGL